MYRSREEVAGRGHWKHSLRGRGSASLHFRCFFPDENSESESDSDDRFKGEVWLPTSMEASPSPSSGE